MAIHENKMNPKSKFCEFEFTFRPNLSKLKEISCKPVQVDSAFS